MFYNKSGVNRDLWIWLQGIASGVRPVIRYDGVVTVMKTGYEVGAKWEFYRGLPVQVRGPELNAKTGEVGIEEIHIAHEGIADGLRVTKYEQPGQSGRSKRSVATSKRARSVNRSRCSSTPRL